MTIHRSYPDADGNPGRTVCGKQLPTTSRWKHTHTPNCPDCNRMSGSPAPRQKRAVR